MTDFSNNVSLIHHDNEKYEFRRSLANISHQHFYLAAPSGAGGNIFFGGGLEWKDYNCRDIEGAKTRTEVYLL